MRPFSRQELNEVPLLVFLGGVLFASVFPSQKMDFAWLGIRTRCLESAYRRLQIDLGAGPRSIGFGSSCGDVSSGNGSRRIHAGLDAQICVFIE